MGNLSALGPVGGVTPHMEGVTLIGTDKPRQAKIGSDRPPDPYAQAASYTRSSSRQPGIENGARRPQSGDTDIHVDHIFTSLNEPGGRGEANF